MSEEQDIFVAGPPPIWVNEHKHLVGFGNGRWQTNNLQYQKGPAIFVSNEHYPCTEIMGRWITSTDPDDAYPSTIDLSEFRYRGNPRMGMDV